jgi:hypothetical protein
LEAKQKEKAAEGILGILGIEPNTKPCLDFWSRNLQNKSDFWISHEPRTPFMYSPLCLRCLVIVRVELWESKLL